MKFKFKVGDTIIFNFRTLEDDGWLTGDTRKRYNKKKGVIKEIIGAYDDTGCLVSGSVRKAIAGYDVLPEGTVDGWGARIGVRETECKRVGPPTLEELMGMK